MRGCKFSERFSHNKAPRRQHRRQSNSANAGTNNRASNNASPDDGGGYDYVYNNNCDYINDYFCNYVRCDFYQYVFYHYGRCQYHFHDFVHKPTADNYLYFHHDKYNVYHDFYRYHNHCFCELALR